MKIGASFVLFQLIALLLSIFPSFFFFFSDVYGTIELRSVNSIQCDEEGMTLVHSAEGQDGSAQS